MSALTKFFKWLHLKQYQIEVTYSVYMFTPIERFVFCTGPPFLISFPFLFSWFIGKQRNKTLTPMARAAFFDPTLANSVFYKTGSVVFLLFSLTFIATTLYLPQHIVFLLNRAWFYVNGDSVDVLEMTKEAVQELAQGALHAGAAGTTTLAAAATKSAKTLVKGEL